MRTTTACVLWAPLVLLVACGPSGRGDDTGDDDDAPPESCTTAGVTRCLGQDFQQCQGGTWQTQESCAAPNVCTDVGCSACDPSYDNTCVGSELYVCNDDGSLGELVMDCGFEGCGGHSCGDPQGCGTDESTQVIYVVDRDYNLLSFDPRQDAHTFTLIGQLDCPAGAPWPAVQEQLEFTAAPFSMSVDREGRAWVLYTSGEIFHVSTDDASCLASGFVKGAQGFQLFGMGFVADAAGAQTEKLYIVGGPDDIYNTTSNNDMSKLGVVDPSSFATSPLGAMPPMMYGPELTGTGNAELWAYFPGGASAGQVARLDKASGAKLQTYTMPALGGTVAAWAFAHYGGRYYIFVTTGIVSQVLRLDPMGNGGAGQVDTVVPSSPYTVVGAGVSTCAPVVVE